MPLVRQDNINTPAYWDAVYREEIARGEDRDYQLRFEWALKGVPLGEAVLDYGCGTGSFCVYVDRVARSRGLACDVWGYDFSAVALKRAGERLPSANFIHSVPDSCKWTLVHCGQVLEHCQSPETMLALLARLAVPKVGRVVVTVPYRDAIRHTEHVYEFDPAELKAMMREVGEVEDVSRVDAGTDQIIVGVMRAK